MQPIPYLFFRGTCAEALTFYAEVFKSPAPQLLRFSDLPSEAKSGMPGVPDDAIMHAALSIGDGHIYASDDPSGETPAMAGCNVNVSLPGPADAEAAFATLSEGGEIRMPIAPTFFAPAFGTLTDRFGTRWMIMADRDTGS